MLDPAGLDPGGTEGGETTGGLPLYRQVAQEIEVLALAGPLGEETVLPPELDLVEQLGVSRGTVRRAIGELERAGLVWRQAGRGTFVNPAARLRRAIWDRLREVAVPDSRFDFDFSHFIPDFEGSERCVEAIAGLHEYRQAATVVATPDNNLDAFRHRALADGKRLLVFTFGMRRGLVELDGTMIGPGDRRLAATLDGMERFGRILTYRELCSSGPIDLVVTGAVAVSREGVHFGKGHGYFDLEWGLLSEIGLVGQETPVVVSVHDCQVVHEPVPRQANDVTVDVIVTPTGAVRCAGLPKPSGLMWDRLPRHLATSRPYFGDVRQARDVHRQRHRHGRAA